VNLESSATDAHILLSHAVEVIPLSVEPWLALARLKTPEHAKAVLNKARKALPTSHEIWIAAGRLLKQEVTAHPEKTQEQRTKELEVVDKTIEAGVRELRRHQVLLMRECKYEPETTTKHSNMSRGCRSDHRHHDPPPCHSNASRRHRSDHPLAHVTSRTRTAMSIDVCTVFARLRETCRQPVHIPTGVFMGSLIAQART